MLIIRGKRFGFEFKHSDAPAANKSIHKALRERLTALPDRLTDIPDQTAQPAVGLVGIQPGVPE